MLRSILSFILLALPTITFSQDQAASARAAAGCGPSDVQFDVKTDKNQHTLVKPEAGKTLVYVIQDEKRDQQADRIIYKGPAITRVGIDGKWMGANHGFSYFFFTVDPGTHRLCTDWQSSFKGRSKLGSALTFTAEAGKVHYFRVEVEQRTDYPAVVKLEPIDNARGEFLVASHALSTPRVKQVASN